MAEWENVVEEDSEVWVEVPELGEEVRARGGTIHRNAPSNEQVDNSNANTPGLPVVSDDEQISNAEESITLNDDATVEEDEGDNWMESKPRVQNFVFNENSGMNIDVPDNVSPVYTE